MGRTIFVGWQLWEQMTFVLACAIVAVFLAGLVKNWRTNRLLKKIEILDVEKKARAAELERTGFPPRQRVEIPFGVRAIQNGIQVDGIWISRSGTPSQDLPTVDSSSLSSDSEYEPEPRRKEKANAVLRSEAKNDSSSIPAATSSSPLHNVYVPGSRTKATPESPRLSPQATYRPKHFPTRVIPFHKSRSDRPTQLGESSTRPTDPLLHHYAPVPIPRPVIPEERSTTSLEQSSNAERKPRGISLRRKKPFPEAMTEESRTHTKYLLDFQEATAFLSADPFATPEVTHRTSSVAARSQELEESAALAPPFPSSTETQAAQSGFPRGPSDSHANQRTRKVNAGFEVLPAGTFGSPTAHFDLESEEHRKGKRLPAHGKLQKKRRSRHLSALE